MHFEKTYKQLRTSSLTKLIKSHRSGEDSSEWRRQEGFWVLIALSNLGLASQISFLCKK